MSDSPNPKPADPLAVDAPDAPAEAPSYGPRFLRGCGCLVVSVALALGVAYGGQAKLESWGSAIIGVIFLVLVVSTSGLTGWWND